MTEAGRADAETTESVVAQTSGEVAPEQTIAEVAGPEATTAAETTAAENTTPSPEQEA